MGRTAAAAALLVLLCAACSDAAPDAGPAVTSTTTAAPAPGLEAEVVRLRTDVAVGGRVQVRVTDSGEEPFTVTAVAIDSPGFAPLPLTPVTAAFAPGRVIDLPTPYGEPRCSADPAPVAARLTVLRPGGAVEDVRVPLAGDALDDVHREECAVAGVLAVAGIVLSGLEPAGDAARGTVVLTRRADDDRAVTVTGARGSVVFDVAAEGLPVELEAGDAEVSTALTFTPATCAPHVLAETKQPFVFPVLVAVGDAEAVPVPLPVERAQEEVFWALVAEVCGGREA